ncbi:uncharacterized protein LOC127702207 [Mytilus californianus]|uniref:uncharacterized protein LOC127702207 n=1 Tax=Mytilus californianus TaxID=6549 RepID=UPI002246A206|nr:uncharacterized protein LOC127702207 [Mytilus californianus]XP_052062278.1 uncharacterized protein LOC127702207 [Mytilus californianus]XP_052062279.1 uncharacterized protein LOC127702207 [Mytilus californianus]
MEVINKKLNQLKIGQKASALSKPDYEHHLSNQEQEPVPYSQAQIPVKSPLMFDVHLRHKFKIGSLLNEYYCVLMNKLLVFTDGDNDRLLIFNRDGSYNREIELYGTPWYISVINDSDIAVLYNTTKYIIDIISIKTGTLSHSVKARGHIRVISFENGLLFVVTGNMIDVMNITGEPIRSFPVPPSHVLQKPNVKSKTFLPCPTPSSFGWNIANHKNRLFLTNAFNNTLCCCDLFGSVIWIFNDDTMKYPFGITTDGNGNVYLTCNDSSNVIAISSDGKHHKEILNEDDGLRRPSGICYDKLNDRLLVCDEGNGQAFLYDIKHST